MRHDRVGSKLAEAAALASVVALSLGTCGTSARAGEQERTEAVYFDPESRPRGTVLLRNLRRVSAIPASAARSVLSSPRANYDHVGVLVPEGAEPAGSEWVEAPLITVEDAVWTVLHDEREAGRGVMIAAGYAPPGAPLEERKPWLEIVTEYRRCDFALDPKEPEDARRLRLLGVAALASPWKIYLDAATPEGESVLVEADYSIVRDTKGLRDVLRYHTGAGGTAKYPGVREPRRAD